MPDQEIKLWAHESATTCWGTINKSWMWRTSLAYAIHVSVLEMYDCIMMCIQITHPSNQKIDILSTIWTQVLNTKCKTQSLHGFLAHSLSIRPRPYPVYSWDQFPQTLPGQEIKLHMGPWKCNNMLGNNQQKLDVTSSLAYTNKHVSSLRDVWLWCASKLGLGLHKITHPWIIQKIDILSTIWPCKAGTSLEEDKKNTWNYQKNRCDAPVNLTKRWQRPIRGQDAEIYWLIDWKRHNLK
jgi:hypothetical protein